MYLTVDDDEARNKDITYKTRKPNLQSNIKIINYLKEIRYTI